MGYNRDVEKAKRMDLVPTLLMLKSGEDVTLGDIARKLGVPEPDAEREITAALTANPALGSFNAFTGTFTRGAPAKKRRWWWIFPVLFCCIILAVIVVMLAFSGLFGK
jgi:hypothetical protein